MIWSNRKPSMLIEGLPDVRVETWVVYPDNDQGHRTHHFKVENNMSVRLSADLLSSLVPAGRLAYVASKEPDQWVWTPSFERMATGSESQGVRVIQHDTPSNTTQATIRATFHEQALTECGLTQSSRAYTGHHVISI